MARTRKCPSPKNFGLLHSYELKAIVHAAPKAMPRTVSSSWLVCTGGSTSWAPLARAGKVVANCMVGFGLPLTVTVGTPAAGLALVPVGEAEEARTVKREDVACITPWVELMKIRK